MFLKLKLSIRFDLSLIAASVTVSNSKLMHVKKSFEVAYHIKMKFQNQLKELLKNKN